MSKKTQIENIAEVAGVTKAVAERCYTALVAQITSELYANGKVEIHGIGALKKTATQARLGRNPRTGEKINIPAGAKLSFSASKALKAAVI